MKHAWLILAVLVGALLRFWNLGAAPLWIDEMLVALWLKEGVFAQEYPLMLIYKVFGLSTEFELRLPSAIAGTLTIPAVWWVLKDKRAGLVAAWMVAVFPLFVFWSRMARPYAFVGLFVVIGWRYWPAYLVALSASPIAAVGVNLLKARERIVPYAVMAALAVVVFFVRPDAAKLSGSGIMDTLSLGRVWYVPLLAAILYAGELIGRRRTT